MKIQNFENWRWRRWYLWKKYSGGISDEKK